MQQKGEDELVNSTAKTKGGKGSKTSLTVQSRRGRLAWLILASIAMAAISAAVAVFDDIVIFQLLGALGVIYFVASTVSLVRGLLDQGPVVTIDRNGIHDRRVTGEPIPWDAFRQGQALESKPSPAFSVELTDDNVHLVHKPWWQGVLTGSVRSGPKNALTIGTYTLETDSATLARAITDASRGRLVLKT